MEDDAKPRYLREWEITRRDVCQWMAGGFLLVQTGEANAGPTRLHFGADGIVTVYTGKIEMGQGARTELTQAAAEELRLEPARVRLVMGDTELGPDDGGTWASLTTPETVPAVRRACAAARWHLIRHVAETWSFNAPVLRTEAGFVITPEGRRIAYHELAREGTASPAADAPLVAPAEWTVLGKPVPPVHGRAIVTGTLTYATDLRPAGALQARVLRGGVVTAHPGVRIVRDGDLTAAVAADRHAVDRAVRTEAALPPWPERARLLQRFRDTAQEPEVQPGARYPALIEQGDAAGALKTAERRHQASYSLPYIAHVPLEPRAAVAEWKDDRLAVWSGTQAPFLVRRELAEYFRIPLEHVRVIACDTGGGFGGKQRGECELEAARIARSAGQPVKLAWTREEEFTCAYARPAGVIDVTSGLDAQGRLAAWDFRNYNSGAASLRPPYAIPHLRCAFYRADAPIKQGSYRSLAGVANCFARETHVEELAALMNADPLEFRLKNIDNERLRTVLLRAAERFGWPRRSTNAGLACNLEKGGHLALFAEVDPTRRRATRMVLAFDAGAVINPDGLKNQLTGGLIQGLGGALFEELPARPRLSNYRVPRFSDVPEIEVILIDRREQPSAGAGEAPITVVAPAIAAALTRATGERLRDLPLTGRQRARGG